MFLEGVSFIDIGGYNSRPNAQEVSLEEEIQRVVPVVETLVREFPHICISVDTFRSKVAQLSLEAGACIINDISAGQIEDTMWEIIQKYQIPYIAMHMRGTPQTMQNYTDYQNIVKDILFYFSQVKDRARQLQINDLIIDPGFGFSKTLSQNYELMQQLSLFRALECPILVGISRKSMLYKLLGTSPEEALNATSVLNTFALLQGADILRVHDVKEGIYPAVDPLASTSRALAPEIVGEEHYKVATTIQRTLQKYRELQDIIAILGMDELSDEC